MNLFDEFYALFNIDKITVKEDSRIVDDNNEICSWYISEEYPSIEPVFFDILNYLDNRFDINETVVFEPFKLRIKLVEVLIKKYKELQEEDREEFKQDIKEYFDDYYKEGKCLLEEET